MIFQWKEWKQLWISMICLSKEGRVIHSRTSMICLLKEAKSSNSNLKAMMISRLKRITIIIKILILIIGIYHRISMIPRSMEQRIRAIITMMTCQSKVVVSSNSSSTMINHTHHALQLLVVVLLNQVSNLRGTLQTTTRSSQGKRNKRKGSADLKLTMDGKVLAMSKLSKKVLGWIIDKCIREKSRHCNLIMIRMMTDR